MVTGGRVVRGGRLGRGDVLGRVLLRFRVWVVRGRLNQRFIDVAAPVVLGVRRLAWPLRRGRLCINDARLIEAEFKAEPLQVSES